MDKLICIKTFSARIDAEIAKSVLNANNIESIVRADDEGGMIVPFAPVKLFISKKDFNKAKDILKK